MAGAGIDDRRIFQAANNVKTVAEIAGWSRQYRMALIRHLKTSSAASLLPARKLGCRAVALGMETLDAARIHEQAVKALVADGGAAGLEPERMARARIFFAEVIVPIEQTHRPALNADAQVSELTQSLHQRTKEAAAKSMQLKRGVVRREAAETALRESTQHRDVLLAEAQRLQVHLRTLTHRIIAAQEAEREKKGMRLKDEIAQVLLAIHVRLLVLDGAARENTERLKNEIAETQEMVRQSSATIQRLAHAFEGDHET